MSIPVYAVEGTLMAAAAIIPLILILGSVEKVLSIIDEIRYRKRLHRQVETLRRQLGKDLRAANA